MELAIVGGIILYIAAFVLAGILGGAKRRARR